MPRFYLPPAAWTSQPVLAGDEARHLSQVLRIRAGEVITIFDGEGRRAEAEVLYVSRDQVPLLLREAIVKPAIRPVITLAQAIPKGKTMDLIVQKAVELGVAAIQPLITRNTIVQPGDGKSEKWRRTALEACKQCGQDTLPRIADPMSIERWLELQQPSRELRMIASLTEDAEPVKKILRNKTDIKEVSILIGPEGDFTDEETYLAVGKGFMLSNLGEITFRVETAAIFFLSVLRYEYA